MNPDEMKVLWFTNNPCSSSARAEKSSDNKDGCGHIVTGGWHSTLEEAVKNDIDLEIAYLSPAQKEEEFEFGGVRYYSINPFKSGFYHLFRFKRFAMPIAWQERRIIARMQEIIERSQPDLIHIHGTERCFGLICTERYNRTEGWQPGTYVCRSGKAIPVAISIQGLIGEITDRFFCGLDRKQIAENESFAIRLRKQSAIRLYREFKARARTERRILSSARYILGRTEWDREKTAQMNPGREYFTVGEIMREPFFHRKLEKAIISQKTRLISVLSTGPYKGFENILRTADLLKRRGNIDFTWTVIGYSASEEYVRISEIVTGLSPEESGIIFTGKLKAINVADRMFRSDIYCQVSHIENSPNSLCEAMVMGVAAIATDVGGTSSMLEDGKDGMLVPDNDPQTYAETIERLAGDYALRHELGMAACTKAQVRHAPATVRKQLLDTYSSILGEQGK
ncbi:MAG: glycosyltransferase family 4 protein [Bacteroidales bacterium]|nr:glycosyltransferase family 4 protein [Bacteroidales bacterium]